MRVLALLPVALLAGCGLSTSSPSIDYDQLRRGMSMEQVRHLPPDRPLECKVPTSGQGYGTCDVAVTELDGLKASRLVYLFEDGKLVAARVEYSPNAFEAVSKMMDARYQRYGKQEPGEAVWKVADGAVISSATELKNGNVYTSWMSEAEVAKALQGG